MSAFKAYGVTPQRVRPSACAFIRDEQGRVLLQRRADNGYWNLPGGGHELGETIAATCVREVLEETGLRVEVIRLIGVYSDPAATTVAYPDGDAVQYIVSLFECRVTGGELTHDHESLELGWFDPGALPEPFSPNHVPRVRDALENRAEAYWR